MGMGVVSGPQWHIGLVVATTILTIGSAPCASWSHLRVGSILYTTNQPICRDEAAIIGLEKTGILSRPNCFFVNRGSAARVARIIPDTVANDADWKYDDHVPYVVLGALNGKWRGITFLSSLRPDIPVGTIIRMEPLEGPLGLYSCRTRCGAIAISDQVDVRVLQYDPGSDDRSLYVVVLSGPLRARKGWMDTSDAAAAHVTNSTSLGIQF